MRVDVVVNARAAKFQKDPQLVAQVGTICRGKAAVHASSSLEQLQDIAHQLAQASPGWIILCGGDGSYMAGVTSLIRAYGTRPLPLLSFASGGNTCTIARNWGRLVHDPVEHVRALLSTFPHEASRSATARPSLSVNDDHASRVGFIFGTGMVSSFFKAFYASGGGGYGHAIQMIARIFAGSFVGGSLAKEVLSPLPCKLVVDGWPHPHDGFTLVVSSAVPNLGLSLRVPHRAGEDPQRPHLVAFRLSVRECGVQYRRVLQGKPLLGPRNVDTLVKRFQVEFPATEQGYVLDGDLFFTSRVSVQAGPVVRAVSL